MTSFQIRLAAALVATAALLGCTPDQLPIIATTSSVDQFARSVLDGLQARSIAEGREYCGYLYLTKGGTLAATPARPGGEDYCDLPATALNVIASYHTHGSYSPAYDNEVPSLDDMRGDFAAMTDGYISTPGGRLWRIDHQARMARQLCSLPCMTPDPANDPADAGHVPQSFTLAQLRARLG